MKARKMAYCAVFAALLAVCGWIAVPFGSSAFTMQTFGVFLTLGLLGGKWGCVAIGVWLAMGAAGLPVFTGLRGGIGVFMEISGGYLIGFVAAGLLFWLLTFRNRGSLRTALAMALGLVCCYACATVWYCTAYHGSLTEGLSACVVPYLVPDVLKTVLAFLLKRRLKRFVY